MGNEVRRIRLSEECLGRAIEAEAVRLPRGVHVLVCGGELPHIGAVSVAGPDGRVETTQFPGHRDGVVSRRWAEALAGAGLLPAVVEAGIHYDALSAEGIQEALGASERLLARVLEVIGDGCSSPI